MRTRGFAVALGILAAACNSDSGTGPSAVATPAPPPPPQTARYMVTFEATWTAQTHAAPPSPHFSRLVGGTHAASVRFWQPGGVASDGIESMAERGGVSPLDAEIMAAIAAGTAQHVFVGDAVPVTPMTVSLEFDVSQQFPLVTLVTMVAPSPDWFVGVDSLPLFEGGDWVAERSVPLRPWDAGTDSGTDFDSPNRDTQPRAPITAIGTPPLGANGTAEPMGTFTFRRLS